MPSDLTRRDLLRLIAKLVSGAGVPIAAFGKSHRKRGKSGRRASNRKKRGVKGSRVRNRARAVDAGPLAGNKLFEDVISYYNLGEHRTATAADLKTSQWLADQLRGAGLKSTFQSFSVRQFFVGQTRLSIGDRVVRVFPLWFPRATDARGISASLVFFDKTNPGRLRDRIALVKFPFDPTWPMTSSRAAIINAAAGAGARAIVAITEGVSQEIIASNTPPVCEPWPIPVVLAGSRDAVALEAAVRGGFNTTLMLDGTDEASAKARNVIGRIDRGKNLIVVSTPQSGWFRCAAERGPGIALFLGLARWAGKRSGGSSFLFVSTSGHELGALGMRAFHDELAPRPERVLCWVHLGAGIATFKWEDGPTGLKRLQEPDSGRSLMCSKDLVASLTESFAEIPGLPPRSDRAVGELELMLKSGYRTFGIAGAHQFHHTPADSPEMTGPEILEPVGLALVKSIEAIEAILRTG